MALFSTNQPSIRARLLPRFPAQVLAGTGITITKSGGTYTFAVNLTGSLPLTGLTPIPAGTILGWGVGGAPSSSPVPMAVTNGLLFADTTTLGLSPNQRSRALNALFPSAAGGQEQDFAVSVACTIKRVTLLANATGNAVIDIWKTTFAGYPPTAVNSICGASTPKLVNAIKFQDSVLPGWTTAVAAGDTLRFIIGSSSGIARLTVTVDVEVT